MLIYLGDYVDRGPDSRTVLEHLSKRNRDDNLYRIALCGNHDDAFLNFMRDPAAHLAWLDFGGDATLRSYGIEPGKIITAAGGVDAIAAALREGVPQAHVDFLENLPVSLTIGDYIFVHAGLKPGIAIEDQDDQDLMWIREPFLTEGPRLPFTVVHGHTAASDPVFGNNRICIDTGCYATGRLTILKIDESGTTLL